MGIREVEIKRLKKYAESLGAKVMVRSDGGDASAEMTLDGREINIYPKNHNSMIEMVLSLIHELGHVLNLIHDKNRIYDMQVHDALDHAEEAELDKVSSSKKQRKFILDLEMAGIPWWDTIIKDCEIKIPKWRIDYQKELDIWVYRYWYDNDRWPKGKDKAIKRKELIAKYKK